MHGDGAQRVLLRVLTNLDKQKFESCVINLRGHSVLVDDFQENGISVYSIDLEASFNILSKLTLLVKIARDFKPDIIQGWLYHGNLIALLLKLVVSPKPKLFWNIRRSVYARSEDKLSTRLIISLNGLFSRFPETIIYCANEVMQQYAKIKFYMGNSKLIPNGFDTKRFAPERDAQNILRTLIGIPQDSLIVGSVGRFHPQKDYDSFLKAAEITHKTFPATHFVLIGRELDNNNTHLKKIIETYGLKDVFHMLGQREDVPSLVPGFDIFCSSSSMEGFANVVGEAMACAVPCVVTDTGASRELVEGLGRVVVRKNPEELAKALCEMLTLTRKERTELGKRCRERIIKGYSLDLILREYHNVYAGLGSDTASV
jgi:glycosyltransferase involved in cell wall biosynthesis